MFVYRVRGEFKKFSERCSHFVIRAFHGINKYDLESPFNSESNCPNGIKKSLTVQKLRRFSSTLLSKRPKKSVFPVHFLENLVAFFDLNQIRKQKANRS